MIDRVDPGSAVEPTDEVGGNGVAVEVALAQVATDHRQHVRLRLRLDAHRADRATGAVGALDQTCDRLGEGRVVGDAAGPTPVEMDAVCVQVQAAAAQLRSLLRKTA